MTEQNIIEQPVIHEKILLKDLDFDNLDLDELLMIKDEIDVVINIKKLVGERSEYIKRQLYEEKEELRKIMLKDLEREKKKLKQKEESEEEDDSDSGIVECVTYNKKTPKGKVTKARGRPPAKKK